MSLEFGQRLALLLNQMGLSQKELAIKTELTEAAVSRYIAGVREPRAITVSKIAKALGVSPQVLLGEEADEDVEGAVRLIARNAGSLTEEQRTQLISALAKR